MNKENEINNSYAKAIDPVTDSEMTIHFDEVDKWVNGQFDVGDFTEDQLRVIISVLGSYLLEQDETAEALCAFAVVNG